MVRLIQVCLLLIILVGCRSNEEELVQLIKQRYSNLSLKNTKQNELVFSELNSYFKNNRLEIKNINSIAAILNKVEDGHIFLTSEIVQPHHSSSIEFYSGTEFIKSCRTCSPEIKPGKYQLLAINNQDLDSWLEANKYLVAASTLHARRFRLIRLISSSENVNVNNIKVKSQNGKIVEVKLNWSPAPKTIERCISGERLSQHLFLLTVKNFWCVTEGGDNSREAIFKNFKNQFDEIAKLIEAKDKLIIDLRNNGGGADLEVEYFLNSFFSRSIYLYPYQHLLVNAPGIFKTILRLFPLNLHLWSKKIDEYTRTENSSDYHFYDNELHVLISAGCFSSCEVVAQAFKYEKRGLLWGAQTHGGAGDPYLFPIGNSNISINLPTCLIWQKNGELFEGVGVAPDNSHPSSLSSDGDDLLLKVTQDKI
jgi:hypothetical protein